MKAAAVCAALAVLAAGCSSAGQSSAAADPRVLVVSEAAGFRHDSIPAAVAFFRSLDGFDVEHLDGGFRELTVKRLRSADAVVFANTSGDPAFSASQRTALLGWVRRGGAVVATHSATDAFLNTWPAYGDLLGARFDRHGPIEPRTVVVEDRRHPATKGLGASFALTEEFYAFRESPRRRAHVLLRLDGRPDRPLAWTRREGRGRVFYSALGHRIEVWRNAQHRRLLRQALAYATRR